MRWAVRTTLACAALWCASGPASADGPTTRATTTTRATQAPELREFRLQNGLRVRIESRRTGGLVSVAMSYPVGQMHNPVGRRGLAHLVEHLAMRASQHVPNGSDALSDVGGQVNAFTTVDETTYVAQVPRGFLDRALWVESDRLGFLVPALTEESVRAEKKIVFHEWIQRNGDAEGGMSSEYIIHELFPAMDPRRSCTDVPKEVEAITLADVREFVSTHYHPENATLAIVGDVDPERAAASVHRYFDDLPRASEEAAARPGELSFTGLMGLTLVSQNEVANLTQFYTVPTPKTVKDAALARVASQRIEDVLRTELMAKRSWASAVDVSVADFGGAWFLLVSVALRGNVRHAVVERAVDEVIGFVQSGNYDVTDAKRSVAVARTRRFARQLNRASDLAEEEIAAPLSAELAAIDAVSLDDVRKYARAHLAPSRRFLVREKAATEAKRVGAIYEKTGVLYGSRAP